MYALTIHQPWAWAIGAGHKLVENRDWLPNWRLLKDGDDLAIHAAVKEPTRIDLQAMSLAARQCGVETVPGIDSDELGIRWGRGRLVAVVTFAGVARAPGDLPDGQRPWWRGKYGWLFTNVRQLNFNNAPKLLGQQGLWALPSGTDLLLRGQLQRAPGELWRKTA